MAIRAARVAAALYLCLGLALTLSPARRLPVRPVEALSTHALPAEARGGGSGDEDGGGGGGGVSVTERHRSYRETVRTADITVNALMLVPLGVLAALGWTRAKARHVALATLALSGSVELAQVVIAGRASQVRDVVLNTLGALAGFAAVRFVRRLRARSAAAAAGG